MKLSSLSFTILLLVQFFISCSNNSPKQLVKIDTVSLNTENTKEYFRSIGFKCSLNDTIVIIPEVGCKGCVSATLAWINHSSSKSNNYKIIINSNNLKAYAKFKFFKNIYLDRNNKMGEYNFGIGYPHLVVIDTNVNYVYPFDYKKANYFDVK